MRFSLLTALALLAAGCPADDDPLEFKLLHRSQTEEEASACGDLSGASFSSSLKEEQYSVRFTFLSRPETLNARDLRRFQLHCQLLVEAKQDVEFLIRTDGYSGQLALRVEAFHSDGKLAYSGMTTGISLDADAITVLLHPAGAQSCFYRSRRRRAFHSATVLPNGEVLFIGGLVGEPGVDPSAILANASVDRFDANTISWSVVANSTDLGLARAFHQAVLLPSPAAGPYKILLLGGLQATTPANPVVARLLTSETHMIIEPHPDAVAGQAGIVTYTPGPQPGLSYEPLAGIAAGVFPQVALSPSGTELLYVPGANAYDADAGFTVDDPRQAWWITLADPPDATAVAALRIRGGHAAAQLAPGSFLVVGGNMDGATASEQLGATASPGDPLTEFVLTDAAPTAYHTLTPIGLPDREPNAAGFGVLRAGGFDIDNAGTPVRSASIATGTPLQRFSHVSPTVSDVTLPSFKAAGYHHALRLHDGSLLLSGGNPGRLQPCTFGSCTSSAECPGECVDNRCVYDQFNQCPLGQLLLLDVGPSGSLSRRVGSEQLALRRRRWGHRAVRLLDNTVLVTGGISLDDQGKSVVLNEAEFFSPLATRRDATDLWVLARPSPDKPLELWENLEEGTECALREDYDDVVSSMKIATSPPPRTSSGRRSRRFRVRRSGARPGRVVAPPR